MGTFSISYWNNNAFAEWRWFGRFLIDKAISTKTLVIDIADDGMNLDIERWRIYNI